MKVTNGRFNVHTKDHSDWRGGKSERDANNKKKKNHEGEKVEKSSHFNSNTIFFLSGR
jgi:hypothetical protein